jgi:lipopolysaccharide export system protein LptA
MRLPLLVLLAAIGLGSSLVARAEKADRDKPINVEADTMTADDQKQVTIWERNVIVTQGTMQIRADKVVVQQFADGTQNATAWGRPVSYRQKREGVEEYVEGYGERVEYFGKDEHVIFHDKARVRRGPDELRGNVISYNSATDFFEAKGGEPNTGGRVRGVFQPRPKDSPPAKPAAPVPLQPSVTLTPPAE